MINEILPHEIEIDYKERNKLHHYKITLIVISLKSQEKSHQQIHMILGKV